MRAKGTFKNRFLAIALVLTLLAVSTWTVGASSNVLSLRWWSVDGGGGESAGGEYRLFGMFGQPESGAASGENYTLTGGVAGGLSAPAGTVPPAAPTRLYLPLLGR